MFFDYCVILLILIKTNEMSDLEKLKILKKYFKPEGYEPLIKLELLHNINPTPLSDEYSDSVRKFNSMKNRFESSFKSCVRKKQAYLRPSWDFKDSDLFSSFNMGHIRLTSSDISTKEIFIEAEITIQNWNKVATQFNVNIDEFLEKLDNLEKISLNYESNYFENILQFYKKLDDLTYDAYSAKNKSDEPSTDPVVAEVLTTITNMVKDPENEKYLSITEFYKRVEHNIELLKIIDDEIIKGIYKKIKDAHPSALNTCAENYNQSYQTKNSVSSFLNDKLQNDYIRFSIDMSKSQTYKKIIVFADFSISLIDKNGKYSHMNDNDEIEKLLNDVIFDDYIDFKLRKRPIISKFFQKMLENEKNHGSVVKPIDKAVITIDSFLEHENILKNTPFQLSRFEEKGLEELDDSIHAIVKTHRIQQYAFKIISNKYKHLYNDKSFELFESLKEANVSESLVQNNIGKKLASFKTSDDLNAALLQFVASFNEFYIENIREKSIGLGSSIVIDDDNVLVVKINNYGQSKLLGSSSWCIVRDEYYYDSYTSNNANQYFIYDFNKTSKDNYSLIGMTLKEDGSLSASHLKDDTALQLTDKVKKMQLDIIKANPSDYPHLSHELKSLLKTNKSIKNIEKPSI